VTGRGDYEGAVRAGRSLVAEAADAAVKRAMQAAAKPTLKRYTWSRLHTDLLDDNRWALVALRAEAPLPIVEALVARLEIHANKSQPRGYVGDFDAEAMAARWHVDAAMVARILAELEGSQIGWIDQDQIVSFWARNPDKVDETAAERMRRMRARKKGMKLLAELARQGLIDEALRRERELALKDCRDAEALVASWSAPAAGRSPPPPSVTRNIVTVTPRAEQIINHDGARHAAPPAELAANLVPIDPAVFAVEAQAFQWLKGDGEALVSGRFGGLKTSARQSIERWAVTLCGDVTGLARIVHAALATGARGEAFRTLVTNQVARQATEKLAPALPLPPVPIKGRSS
jgi:hypothetical protein